MNSFKFKDYIESNTFKKEEENIRDHKYDKLEVFFNSITSVLLDENLSIVLLNNELKIIGVYSSDQQNYKYLYNREFNLDILTQQENLPIESINENQLSIFLSPIFRGEIDNTEYRFVLLSLDKTLEKLKLLSNSLHLGLNNLLKYDQTEFNNYHNLVNYLDSVDEGISACDNKGIVTYINKSASNILNATKDEILDQNLETLISDSILVKVVKNKKAYLDIEYFIDYKNKNIHLMNSAYPVYNRDKNIIGAVDIYRKIKRSIKIATDLVGYEATYKFEHFIGESRVLYDAIEISKKFANSFKNILIIGESGTGKELFAQAIHNYSVRRKGPFVAINCASYPKDLFESELFGYDEGAFTGAKKGGKTGKFELADGGTLFLDEIGEMPLHLQAKLLRIIETKSISRIGSNKKVDVNVRIIAATNRNLEDMVKNNSFREDLYYRLKVLYLHLPPLRNRQEDSVLLCNYFICKFSKDSTKNVICLDNEATEYIKAYDWPGNIRELENIISLSLFYCEGEYVTKKDLIKSGLKITNEINLDTSYEQLKLSTITNEIILNTLEKNNGNKKKTAEELGISRNTIYRLL